MKKSNVVKNPGSPVPIKTSSIKTDMKGVKTSGIKVRGTGAAITGTMARGPMA